MMKSGRGFTLAELLTVLVVAAGCAAVFLPAMSRAGEDAGRAACAENLRKLGGVFGMYLNDHDGIMFNGRTTRHLDGETRMPLTYFMRHLARDYREQMEVSAGWSWNYADTSRYAANRERAGLWACPSRSPGTETNWGYDYGMSTFLNVAARGINTASDGVPHRWSYFRMEWMMWPERIMFLADMGGNRDVVTAPGSIEGRHGGGANLLFSDFHVDWLECPLPEAPASTWAGRTGRPEDAYGDFLPWY